MANPRVETTRVIIIDKHELSILKKAQEILEDLHSNYDCNDAVDEECSFQMYQLCDSLSELLEMIKSE